MLLRLKSWQRSLSVSNRTALSLALGLAMLIIATATMAFSEERSKAISDSLARLDQHNAQIVDGLEQRFERIAMIQKRAGVLFAAERAGLDDATVQREFDELYPRRADGTRRSTDAMFEGGNGPLGLTRGMAAFIPGGIDQDAEAVRDIVAATRAIRALGEGSSFEIESLYFFTPANAIVIYAPQRPDRLTFYRKNVPASFNFQNLEFATISTPTANPGRAMACTSLQTVISVKAGNAWTTGCMTPVDRNGQHIGTFGTSIPLHELVNLANMGQTKGEQIVLVSREGRLILHPRYTRQNNGTTGQFLDLSKAKQPDLRELWRFVQANGNARFTGKAPALDGYASIRSLPSTGWQSLVIAPEGNILAQALRPIRRIGLSALITLGLSVLIVTMMLSRMVGKPLAQMADDAQRITDELADDQMIATPDSDPGGNEVTRLVRRFELLAGAIRHSHSMLEQRVEERTHALNQANQQLRNLSEIDALTGMANRRKILADLEGRIERLREGGALALMLIDVDHFKTINDGHGHIAGDDALRRLAERMHNLLRAGDALGRIGGEEFMVILDRARPVVADGIAERMRAAIANQRFEVHGNIMLPVTISIGVTTWVPGDTVTTLYARADSALYEAKTAGRNCVVTRNGTGKSTSRQHAA